MKIELLIKKIFNNMALMIINKVSQEYHQELLNGYCNYLVKRYAEYEVNDDNFEMYLNSFSELEVSRWKNVDEKGKLSLLLEDPALEKIRDISEKGYNYAKSKLISGLNNSVSNNDSLDKKNAKKYINLLNETLTKVRDFNEVLAENLVSEGILDYEYASGNTACTSFRLSRLF